MQRLTLGSLSATLVPPRGEGAAQQTVLLLHGYGAPGTDLVGLAREIPAPDSTQFVFLEAAHTLPGMTGPGAGRAWWHIDMMALQVARMTGQHEMLAAQKPEGLDEARELLALAVSALTKEHGVSTESLIVGGFSQGAMLSCDYVLRAKLPFRGLLQLSGTTICERDWVRLMAGRGGLRVFQSHSPDDQVLPYGLAERLRDHMKENGMDHEFVTFRGGHGIGREVLLGLGRFLKLPEVAH